MGTFVTRVDAISLLRATMTALTCCMVALGAMTVAFARPPAPPADNGLHAHPLVWDEPEKTYEVSPGSTSIRFTFTATNRSSEPVSINGILTSCGCTTMDLSDLPWRLAPGATRMLQGVVDTKGKEGRLSKAVTIETSAGPQELHVVVEIPSTPDDDPMRQHNQGIALADRQAVFHGNCASCHAAPLVGRLGGDLYAASCQVCHGAVNRASMVPDLVVTREHRDASYWRKWIATGREGSLMPAFAQKQGGPLTPNQIESLIAYLLDRLPTDPPRK